LVRLSFALVLFAMLAFAVPAHATNVAIVAPPSPSAEVAEALTRLRGELLSVDLAVTVGTRLSDGSDSRGWLENLARERSAAAIIDIVGDGALSAVDVWVVKKEPGRFEVTRVDVEPDTTNPSERIALRAMDALRASLLEIDWAARQRREHAEDTPPPQITSGSEPPGLHHRLGFELGVAGLTGVDGVGLAAVPTARVDVLARAWLVLQATLAGAGSRPTVRTADAETRVSQQYGLLGACLRNRAERRWWPMVSLAAGVLHTSLEGRTGVDTLGQSVEQWSFLIDVGMGAGLRLSDRTFLTLAAHAQVAAPYVAVHLVDTVAGTSGRPNLLGVLTLGAWL
jgi:hypothetical protein